MPKKIDRMSVAELRRFRQLEDENKKLKRFVCVLLETFAFVIVVSLVIIFLRPISQFIYFQF